MGASLVQVLLHAAQGFRRATAWQAPACSWQAHASLAGGGGSGSQRQQEPRALPDPAGPQAPSARDAEPSPALPRCEGVLGLLQGLRGADCKCGLLGDFLPGFSATAGAVLF